MILWRPVGLEELRLVYGAEMRRFPPRLPDQPIFYPVLTEWYARGIAEDWNTKSGSLAGFVTRFMVDDPYASKFEPHIVGTRRHEELWVPAEELDEFSGHIEGSITVTSAHFGAGYRGFVPANFGLSNMAATEQFVALAKTLPYSGMDFACEIAANHTAIFLNYFVWEQPGFEPAGASAEDRRRTLESIGTVWRRGERGHIPLGVAAA
jgi:hypothetical protein